MTELKKVIIMLGCYCSIRNRLYKLLGRYTICLIKQVGLPKCGPNLYQIAKLLSNSTIEPIQDPTIKDLILTAITTETNKKKCYPPRSNSCLGAGLGQPVEFISYYLGEYVYRLLYGLYHKKLDQMLYRIFSYACPTKRRQCLNELLLQALSDKKK